MQKLTLIAFGVIGLACGLPTEPIKGPPDFSGTVVLVRDNRANYGQLEIWIERGVEDIGIVRISGATRVYADVQNRSEPAGPELLVAGAAVDVWTTGVELRFLPPRYDGTQIVVR